MLGYALNLLAGSEPGQRASMYFECFAVHARNCRVFLMNEDGNNYKARDYNKDFVASSESADDAEALKLITRLDTRAFHLAKSERDRHRITVGDAVKMYRWIAQELERFGRELPKVYQATWSASVTIGNSIVAVVDAGAYATNHFSNTASYSPGVALVTGGELRLNDGGDYVVVHDAARD